MPREIEISGKLVRIKEVEVIGEGNLEDMMPYLENRVPITSPVLPSRTVLFHWDESDTLHKRISVAVQQDAGARTLTFNEARNKNRKLMLPYSLFVFQAEVSGDPYTAEWVMQDYKIFWSKEPITHYNQTIIAALTPNVYKDGRVCGGGGVGNVLTLKAMADKFANEWYLIDFSAVGHNREHAMPWDDTNFDRWEKMSAENPQEYKNWPEWDPTTREGKFHKHYTVAEAMKEKIDRTLEMRLTDDIPDLNFRATFGGARDWVNGLTANQRTRLLTALQAGQ